VKTSRIRWFHDRKILFRQTCVQPGSASPVERPSCLPSGRKSRKMKRINAAQAAPRAQHCAYKWNGNAGFSGKSPPGSGTWQSRRLYAPDLPEVWPDLVSDFNTTGKTQSPEAQSAEAGSLIRHGERPAEGGQAVGPGNAAQRSAAEACQHERKLTSHQAH
jgi:hypothetical protein